MKISKHVIAVAIMASLIMSGCVAYSRPYASYGGYGGYGSGYGYSAPVVAMPMYGGGWGHRGFGHHRH